MSVEAKLAIVVPFCNEYPLILTTIRAIGEELKDRGVAFEVIAVDNWCGEVAAQGRTPDRGHTLVESLAKSIPWLRVVKYSNRLSHWQSKNKAISESDADFFFFCDAHTLPSRKALWRMFLYYEANHEALNGTIHLPLTYHILEEKRLIYRLKWDVQRQDPHYTFTTAKNPGIYEVPCMSSCGMMMSREIYDKLGGWPTELGIYGGGENFVNFVLSTFGMKKWIFGLDPLYHHGEKRGYNWNGKDYERNRLIAVYMIGGTEMVGKYIPNRTKHHPSARVMWKMFEEIVETSNAHREHIKKQQIVPFNEWAKEGQS